MTRKEHLEWAKKRAIEYIDRGDGVNAMASMMSDLPKHQAWQNDGFLVASLTAIGVRTEDLPAVRRWIDGFN